MSPEPGSPPAEPRAAAAAPRVAVVGGGLAGLAAAHRLQRGGASVAVYEARSSLGGRTRTDAVDDCRIDVFTQFFGSMYRRLLALLGAVGAAGLKVREPGRDALWRSGRAHEVVYGSVGSMLASGALPMSTKLRLGTRYLGFLQRHARHLEMDALDGAVEAGLDDASIAEWGARRLGSDFVELLAYPLLAAQFGVEPEQTSAALYHALALQGTEFSVFSLRGGVGGLADAVAEAVRLEGGSVRTATEVVRVQPREGGYLVSGNGWSEGFDGVVICTPAPEAPRIVESLDPAAREWFAGVRYQPLASLALLLDAPLGVRYFGLSFPRNVSALVATACVQENKAAGLVPAGRGLLLVLPAPRAARRFLDSDPEALLEAVTPELVRAFPGVASAIRRVKLYRWPTGGPVFYPGYLRHLQAFPQRVESADPRLRFAGDYLVFPSPEGSVVSGQRAADRLLAALGRTS